MTRKNTDMMIIAGDIGGTKTELALFSHDGGASMEITSKRRYMNEGYEGIADLLECFIKEEVGELSAEISSATLGVAGAVEGRICEATNIAWRVDAEELEKRFSFKECLLLNDLEALGYYVSSLQGHEDTDKSELYCLQKGRDGGGVGNAAVIAAGTGLGESILYWDGTTHHPLATEGGHTDFAPLGEWQEGLFGYLKRKYEHVSYERLLSGMGLENIYDYLSAIMDEKEVSSVVARFSREDRASVIGEVGLSGGSILAAEALRVFVSIYGAEAGNLALKAGASGGVYIGGGIASKILPVIEAGWFIEAFLAKGRMRGLLKSFPVYMVTDKDAMLKGAATYYRIMSVGK